MKYAIVTMSYKADYEECLLLCESIDKFVHRKIPHYIFVNDEDLGLFENLNCSRRTVLPKSVVLPQYLVRIPIRILGHHFHVSPVSIPVREWIIQQIVKLSVWEVIDPQYDIFLNVDSENVFMKPFDMEVVVKEGKLGVFRKAYDGRFIEAQTQFCSSAKRLLGLKEPLEELLVNDYMASLVGFERKTLMAMCREIGQRHWSHNYKIALMNTYRFSEYFLYAMYVYFKKDPLLTTHFDLQDSLFPMLKFADFSSKEEVNNRMKQLLSKDSTCGIFFQKDGIRFRKECPVDFPALKEIVHAHWKHQ